MNTELEKRKIKLRRLTVVMFSLGIVGVGVAAGAVKWWLAVLWFSAMSFMFAFVAAGMAKEIKE